MTKLLSMTVIDYDDDPGYEVKSVGKMDLIKNDAKLLTYRKYVEKEFYDSFKMFLWVNQAFCTVTVNLNLLEQTAERKMKIVSALHMIYAVLISACIIVATFWQHQQFDTSIGFLTGVLYMGEYSIGTISFVLVIIASHYHKKTYKIFFDRILNVDMSLLKCGIQPNFDSSRIFLRRSMVAFTIFFSLVIAADILSKDPRSDSFIISSSVYTIPNMVVSLSLLQYDAALHYIQDRMKTLNEILQRLATNSCFIDHQQMVSSRVNVISVLSMNLGQNGTEKVLNILRKQHAELSRIMELVTGCFGMLIVLTFLVAYISLSSQLYEFYKMSVGFDNVMSWLTLYTILWLILNAGKVILILYPANDFSDERKRTASLLYKMDSKNSKTLVTIKTFSNQLLHETLPPNAIRIINLDMTNIATMVGILTTYLIILIQFDISAREQKVQSKTP